MSFNGDDHTRILSINDTHINVHNGAIIEYIAPFYKEHIDLPFIGMVLSDCSPNDTIIGIYIQPSIFIESINGTKSATIKYQSIINTLNIHIY